MQIPNIQRCLACYQPLPEATNDWMHPACAKRLFGFPQVPQLVPLHRGLEQAAETFLNKGIAVTGVQRKLSLHLETKQPQRFTIVGALGGNFILKPQSTDFPQLPELEDLTMHLAKALGIQTAEHALLASDDDTLVYVTKRFDRVGARKVAQEDACQLLELPTEQKYRSSHEQLAKIFRKHSSFPGDDLLRLFELTAFSYLTGNADMHLKNFSIAQSRQRRFRMTPAYDLVPTRLVISEKEDPEELALSLGGKRRKFKTEDFLAYADYLSIPRKVIDQTWKRWQKRLPFLNQLIEDSFLKTGTKTRYCQLIEQRWLTLSGG